MSLVSTAANSAVLGRYTEVCRAGKPAAIARISGMKTAAGLLSVKLYPADQAAFLEKGAYIAKVDVPITGQSPVDICVPVPKPGTYAIAVRHQVSGTKSRMDGGGFSGNPTISLISIATKRKPQLNEVAFVVKTSPSVVPVRLKYL